MSAKIHILDAVVANRIAAGEVVERPASVVKELVENALDAGASKITVDVEKGGRRLIRITDDGVGMTREDAELSIQRHATSKVRTTDDIGNISTLGFRGEALPSIASVSDFRMATRMADQSEGTELLVRGGELQEIRSAGVPVGTEIEVSRLFFHMPARRKFLKTDATEWGHIDGLLTRCALCHPVVHWEWRHNGGSWNRYPAVKTLDERILQLFGREWSDQTLALVETTTRHGWSFTGRVSVPENTRSHRNEQYWFINGRPIVHAGLAYALQEGFGAHISKGRHPAGVFFLKLPIEDVDVNVHPAKREVRLRNENAVRRLISETVNDLLQDWSRKKSEAARSKILANASRQDSDLVEVAAVEEAKPQVKLRISRPEPEQVEWTDEETDATSAKDSEERNPPTATRPAAPETPAGFGLQLFGKAEPGLILAQNDEGLVLIHIQAAFERIYYEELMERFTRERSESQALLVPVQLDFSAEQTAFVQQAKSHLQQAGISIDSLGGNTFIVDALPAAVSSRDPQQFVYEVVETLSQSSDRARTASKLENSQVAAAIARHMSRGRRAEGEAEWTWLLNRLYQCELPYTRPDGRPTMTMLSQHELKRRFQVD